MFPTAFGIWDLCNYRGKKNLEKCENRNWRDISVMFYLCHNPGARMHSLGVPLELEDRGLGCL